MVVIVHSLYVFTILGSRSFGFTVYWHCILIYLDLPIYQLEKNRPWEKLEFGLFTKLVVTFSVA